MSQDKTEVSASDATPANSEVPAAAHNLVSSGPVSAFANFNRGFLQPFYARQLHVGHAQAPEAVIFLLGDANGEIGLAAKSRHDNDSHMILCDAGARQAPHTPPRRKVFQLVEDLANKVIFPKESVSKVDTGRTYMTSAERARLNMHPYDPRKPEWLDDMTLAVHHQEWIVGRPKGTPQPTFTFNFVVIDKARAEEKAARDAAKLHQPPPHSLSMLPINTTLPMSCRPAGVAEEVVSAYLVTVPALIRANKMTSTIRF